MPNGRYSLHDPHDHVLLGEERFSCAPGPAGWRYVSKTYAPDGSTLGTVDLTLDSRSRPLRMELRSGGWQVRGSGGRGGLGAHRPRRSDRHLGHRRPRPRPRLRR